MTKPAIIRKKRCFSPLLFLAGGCRHNPAPIKLGPVQVKIVWREGSVMPILLGITSGRLSVIFWCISATKAPLSKCAFRGIGRAPKGFPLPLTLWPSAPLSRLCPSVSGLKRPQSAWRFCLSGVPPPLQPSPHCKPLSVGLLMKTGDSGASLAMEPVPPLRATVVSPQGATD